MKALIYKTGASTMNKVAVVTSGIAYYSKKYLRDDVNWVISMKDLEELIDIMRELDEELIIKPSRSREYDFEIEIYDGYRE